MADQFCQKIVVASWLLEALTSTPQACRPPFVPILLLMSKEVISSCSESSWRIEVAKKATKKRISRKEYTASDVKLLKAHSKARTPVSKLTKLMKRSEGSLRQKALTLGIGLGHQR
jgi:hypothetical protein